MGDDPFNESRGEIKNEDVSNKGKGKALNEDYGLRYVQYDVQQEHIFLDPIRYLISKDLSGW
jgi:hypothetical protein